MQQRMINVQNIAETFLHIAKSNEFASTLVNSFPRDIEALLLFTLELPVEYRIDLTLHSAEQYLCALRGIPYSPPNEPDRKLMGLLCVGHPANVILIQADLPNHIQNYVLAHELAHFLVDIFRLRNLWLSTLPDRHTEILKAFSWTDYDHWLDFEVYLKGLPQRPRSIIARGNKQLRETEEKELEADLVARELLLPWDEAVNIYELAIDREQFTAQAYENYRLPLRVANDYYLDIRRFLTRPANLFETLFLSDPDSDSQ